MSEIPQQTSRQRSKLPQANPAGVKRVKSLLRYRQIAERVLPGPPEPTKPVVEVPGWRWTANWSGEWSWGIYSVLAMLLVVLFALADQGLLAVTTHHHAVALDVVRLTTTTTTIDELMGKCALGTKLSLQMVISRHVPAVAVEGMIFQLSSAEIDAIGLKKTDNGLENEVRRACVSFAKPVSQGSAMLDETPLGPCMRINENLLNEPQSKSATLTTSSKLPESGYPEKSIAMIEVDTRQMYAFDMAHWGAYDIKDSLPLAVTRYNQTPEVACSLPAVDGCIHLELLSHNAYDRPPDAADHVSATTVHIGSPSDLTRKLQENRGIIVTVIRDDPEEDVPAGALENARSPPKPVPWICCKNVVTATSDVGFCSSHKDSDLKANRIIGNRTWLVSPVNVRSGRIGRWFFRFLDKSALVGSQWELILWTLAAQAMLPRGTARHEGIQASMSWREETGLFQSMRLPPTQVTYAMTHNFNKYPPSKNRFKDARARGYMRHKRMRQATDGYGGCILGNGFSTTSFGDAAAIAISTSEVSVTRPDCEGVLS
ncbi:hypothetical protein BU17DRAFT_99517 [Hysterangium stoloniferum]|nr:hypothetical protein BU17DRAFT_99517 [Hysterangium stoloniferum]